MDGGSSLVVIDLISVDPLLRINGSRVTEKEQGLNSFISHAFLVAVALYFFKAVSDF